MYRSSNNHIYHNRLDFNVRGFSFGKYYRGQDSAGILVFEQCNNNVFAYNSVTHSGDGFFLWAGQFTMDTGEGGCNDNLFYSNDFSYAPTNGVELTFSRNAIYRNTISNCDNGIWAGYSFATSMISNTVDSNKTAIAIEHGQFNHIDGNSFTGNKTSIKLWSNEKQPTGWGYVMHRNTQSKNYCINSNVFNKEGLVYDFVRTDSIQLKFNYKYDCNKIINQGPGVSYIDTSLETCGCLDAYVFGDPDSIR